MSSSAQRTRVGGGLRRCRQLLRRLRSKPSPLQYWQSRAEQHGVRSVVHMGHSEDELAAVTRKQKQILLPLFRAQLRGDERRVLDFGSGPGRFSADLARLSAAHVVGLDPTAALLSLAPPSADVSRVRALGTRIPAPDAAFDAVWVCQVLGGMTDAGELAAAVAEIGRVLAPNGLLFVVENTSDKPDVEYWRYRSPRFYRDLFPAHSLEHLADYDDLGERNCILGGRSRA